MGIAERHQAAQFVRATAPQRGKAAAQQLFGGKTQHGFAIATDLKQNKVSLSGDQQQTVGLHGCSQVNQFALAVCQIRLTEGGANVR
jgi:hypothetical protein